MSASDNGSVTLNISDSGIATITFYHPAQNSLPAALLDELAEKIIGAGNDAQVRVIVLKSGGDRTFCAGASFDELLQIKDKEAGAVFFSGFAKIINACRNSSKIVIARIQGKAVGGGVGIAAAADYCLATEVASIKLSELAIGIGPFVISPAVTRKTCPVGNNSARPWRAPWLPIPPSSCLMNHSPRLMPERVRGCLMK